jgi:hypothetical protein
MQIKEVGWSRSTGSIPLRVSDSFFSSCPAGRAISLFWAKRMKEIARIETQLIPSIQQDCHYRIEIHSGRRSPPSPIQDHAEWKDVSRVMGEAYDPLLKCKRELT